MAGELIGLVTCPQGKGPDIARQIVSERLAACVNILPSIKSIYFWQGKLEDDSEELLLIKTHEDKWQALQRRIKEIHPYEVPEIICIHIQDGYTPYLNWLKSNVGV